MLTHRAMCESVHCRSKTDKRILYVGGLDEDVDLAVLNCHRIWTIFFALVLDFNSFEFLIRIKSMSKITS